ncbi:hypothetical protein [Glycomyces tarimensis]
MNPHEMRELFEDTLAESQPVAGAGTDDIVTAGQRRLRRRRTAQAGSGALAAVAVVAALALAPSAFSGQGRPDAAAPGESESPADVCAAPTEEPTGEQERTAAMYDAALMAYVASIGGEVDALCAESRSDGDGFHYDPQFGRYRFAETAVFPASGEQVMLNVDVHGPADGDAQARLEDLSACAALDLTCTWDAVPEGTLLLVEEYRTIAFDEDEQFEGERVPVRGALLARDDGTIVHVQLGAEGGPGTVSTTPEQLGELAAAIPVDEDAADGALDRLARAA